MATYLDDEPVDLGIGDLGMLLTAAKAQLAPTGRVVVEVQLDDESLSSEQIERQYGQAVDGTLRLYTALPRELAASTLAQVGARLDEAATMQGRIAELLQADEAAKAMKTLAEFVSIWLQTQQAVLHSAMLVGIALDDLEVRGVAMTALTQQLIDRLNELKELVAAQDTVGLADAMAYEWPAVTDQWIDVVETLMERIGSSV